MRPLGLLPLGRMRRTILTSLLLGLLLCFSGAHAQNAATLIQRGDELLAANSPAKAMDMFNAALAMEHSADAYAGRARAWFYQGKLDKFMEDVNDALRLDSTHAKANLQRAVYALRAEDNQAAIGFTSRALNNNPKPDTRKRLLVVRGEAAAAMGMADKAIEDLTEGLEGNTEDLDAMKTLARLQDAAGNPAASLVVLEKLCELAPNDIGNWSNRGFELNRLERYEEAIPVFERALQMDRDEPVVLSNMAYALLKLDRDKEALATVNRSLRSDKVNPYALRTRALLYLRKGDRAKACTDLTLAKAMGGAPEVDSLVKQHCAGMKEKR